MKILPIVFTYSTDKSFQVQLAAEVELPDLIPHYRVKNIQLAGKANRPPVVSDLTIKCIIHNDIRIWVHTDSNMSSELSRAIGAAIESGLPEIEMASAADPLADDDLPVA